MKYFPLVWAAIMRRPARAILTLLAVMAAFILFGLTLGMNVTFSDVSSKARDNRIYTDARFGGPMPLAAADELRKLPGVAAVATQGFVNGYHGDPKNRSNIMFLSPETRKVMSDWPLSPQQWDMIEKNRTGVVISKLQAQKWNLKVGDNFTLTTPAFPRTDGTNWTVQVMAVADDIGYFNQGYMMGNFDYFDQSRPAALRGRANQYIVLTSDPDGAAAIADEIDNHLANSATPTSSWTEKAALDISNSGLDFIAVDRDVALAGMFMVIFLIANGIARSVRERFPEFAMLRTLGFSDTGVILLVFVEAALPCIVGALLGVALSAGITALIPHYFPRGIGTPVLPTVTASVFLWAGLAAAVVALASSALPALRLRRMDIATALAGR
jgi:putative ABC transport system permease protein